MAAHSQEPPTGEASAMSTFISDQQAQRLAEIDTRSDPFHIPGPDDTPAAPADPRLLRDLIPRQEPGREVDDWGRSERVFSMVEPVLNFYYRYWFRVEQEGIEHVPANGGALLVS